MMQRVGYRLLFWGFLMVLIDVNVVGFDLCADIIGYILINAGLQRLTVQHPQYRKARTSASLLIVVSLAVMSQPFFVQTTQSVGSPGSIVFLLLGQAVIILNLVLVYRVCTAIHELAVDKNLYTLSDSARFRRRASVVSTCAILGMVPFTLTMGKPAAYVLLILAVISIIVSFSIILLLRKAGRELTAVAP